MGAKFIRTALTTVLFAVGILIVILANPFPAHSEDSITPALQRAELDATATVPVTAENFVRAESEMHFAATVKGYDAFGKFDHNRKPTPIDKQTVVRTNRDTLYSAARFDLDAGPVTITPPDAGKRFLSMQVINQDHYPPIVISGGGGHTPTRETIDM